LHVVVFLQKLESSTPLPATHIHALTNLYKFNGTKNAEVGLRWYKLALISPAASDFTRSAAEWVVDPDNFKGRMKFCRPVFHAVYKVDASLARETFEKHEMEFHPIARKMIAKVSPSLSYTVMFLMAFLWVRPWDWRK